MIRWWQRSLATRFIILIMLALVVSQSISYFLSWNEHAKFSAASAKGEFFSRTHSVAQLMEALPTATRQEALLASETRYSRFWLTDSRPGEADAWRDTTAREFSRPIANLVDLPLHYGADFSDALNGPNPALITTVGPGDVWRTPSNVFWKMPGEALTTSLGDRQGYGLAVQLNDGQWLNSATYRPNADGWWNSQFIFSLAIAGVALAAISAMVTRQIVLPLRQLAASAEAVGRGENVPSLPEEGPDDIKQTAIAFNRMQSRLFRVVEDRTRMLAAIGHDLRTPLTSLKLRAEFVPDDEMKQRMMATIDEIQGMTEAIIALARGEATAEETRAVDLDALVGSLCEDMADMGHPVVYRDATRTIHRCRPDALRRAIRNIVENAVRYGSRADVELVATPSAIEIRVLDEGPGIPVDMHEKVFDAFFRLETSRNRSTGGVGLGLATARAIARRHGGDIVLSARDQGLLATIVLPISDTDAASVDELLSAA